MFKGHIRQSGFTLTEAIVVMAIISIGAAMAIPYFRSKVPHFSVRTSGRDLVTDMRMAQGLAVKTGAAHQISFDLVNDLYKIICAADNDLTPGSPPWQAPCEPKPLPHLARNPAVDIPTRKLAADKGVGAVKLVSVEDAVPASLTNILFAGNGSVIFPAGNFPVTITLQSYERTTECLQIRVNRGGKMETIILAPAVCGAL